MWRGKAHAEDRMPTYSASVDIGASPEDVFAYVADLTKHGEWAADPLRVEALAPSSGAVGSRYRSTAQVQGRPIEAELRVTERQPPSRFAFVATDITGVYEHQFTFRPHEGGTRVERNISASLSLPQRLLFLVVYPFRKLPNTRSAMSRLKARLEQHV
jgi:uncharacterized protein YndB with AHSA1/START domain